MEYFGFRVEADLEDQLEYLMALQRHATQVAQDPPCWLPWNYQQAIKAPPSG